MGRRENTSDRDGSGNFDLSKTKDVAEAGDGKHSDEDTGPELDEDEDPSP